MMQRSVGDLSMVGVAAGGGGLFATPRSVRRLQVEVTTPGGGKGAVGGGGGGRGGDESPYATMRRPPLGVTASTHSLHGGGGRGVNNLASKFVSRRMVDLLLDIAV